MKLTAPIAGLVLAAALAGCATTTAYQPRTANSAQGYADTRLEDNRFRVTFSGNTATSRETVETYLLYRAAALALALHACHREGTHRLVPLEHAAPGLGA